MTGILRRTLLAASTRPDEPAPCAMLHAPIVHLGRGRRSGDGGGVGIASPTDP